MKFLALLLMVGAFIGIFVLNNAAGKSLGKKKRCPYCGNYGAKAKGGRYYRNGKGGIDWLCKNCGNIFFFVEWGMVVKICFKT